MKVPTYTVRLWQDGHIVQELVTQNRKRAALAWMRWDVWEDYGVELLVNGDHIPACQVWKVLGIKYSDFWRGWNEYRQRATGEDAH